MNTHTHTDMQPLTCMINRVSCLPLICFDTCLNAKVNNYAMYIITHTHKKRRGHRCQSKPVTLRHIMHLCCNLCYATSVYCVCLCMFDTVCAYGRSSPSAGRVCFQLVFLSALSFPHTALSTTRQSFTGCSELSSASRSPEAPLAQIKNLQYHRVI